MVDVVFVPVALFQIMFANEDGVVPVNVKLAIVALVANRFVAVALAAARFVTVPFVANKLVEVEFVLVVLVKTPVDGVEAPIAVLSINPPSISTN